MVATSVRAAERRGRSVLVIGLAMAERAEEARVHESKARAAADSVIAMAITATSALRMEIEATSAS